MLSQKLGDISFKAAHAQRLKQDALQLHHRIVRMEQNSLRAKTLIDTYKIKLDSIKRTPEVMAAEAMQKRTRFDEADVSIFWVLVNLHFDIIKQTHLQKELLEAIHIAKNDLTRTMQASTNLIADLSVALEETAPMAVSLGIEDAISEYERCLSDCIISLEDA